MTREAPWGSAEAVGRIPPLVLAYVGDAVYELAVRERLVEARTGKVNALHREAVALVRAAAQAEALQRLEGHLSPEESDVVRRARNAKPGTTPRSVPVQEYRWATAFEALVGYLHLSGQRERLAELLALAWAEGGR